MISEKTGSVPSLPGFVRGVVRRLGRGTLVLPFLYMVLLFCLSQVPGGEKDVLGYSFEMSPRIGNFLHIPAYFVLALLWKIAFEVRHLPGGRSSALALLYATLFGALDEVHQYFVPERYMDIRDVIANFLGALLAVVSWRFLRRLFF